MLTDEHASPSQQNEVPMDRDPEKDFKVATKTLEELWFAMNHVVGAAGHIIHRIKDDRPLPDSPPEMKIEYECLNTHRKECVEAFNVGLEPTSATNSRLTHGYLSPYCIYKAAGVKPPKDVERGPFLFQAVIALAQHLIEIGWNGQPGIDTKCVHPVNMPSRDQLPAFRLCDNKRWEALHVPFLMSEKIQIAFDNALSRERSRAEEVLRTRMIEAKRTMDLEEAVANLVTRPALTVETPTAKPDAPAGKRKKRSTTRGKGQTKLLSALAVHHRYGQPCGLLNLESIGCRALAKAVGVAPATASKFFKDNFGSLTSYEGTCRDAKGLHAKLKLLYDDFADPSYGSEPNEGDE